ncbi:hypothetical protein GOBAR_DD20428 [Gossypium barbadense]|nr:hypothetical protein GOBAR_DD20428 [Gossypium barbadense]
MSSSWGAKILCAILVNSAYSLAEFLSCGGTVQGWLNEERMRMFKRTTTYFFAFVDNIAKLCGFSKLVFIISRKVADAYWRYKQEVMEFWSTPPTSTLQFYQHMLCSISKASFGK